jgi:hypothetical protein
LPVAPVFARCICGVAIGKRVAIRFSGGRSAIGGAFSTLGASGIINADPLASGV